MLEKLTEFLRWLFNKLQNSSGGRFEVGKMYLFKYNPKHKKTLPYYDMLPLIIVFKIGNDRFWGLNLHYLAPNLRIQLLKQLYQYAVIKDDEITRFNISYDEIKNNNIFKPCIKEYLYSHVTSRIALIKEEEWFNIPYIEDEELFLNDIVIAPIEDFKKMNKAQVWKESEKIVYKGK